MPEIKTKLQQELSFCVDQLGNSAKALYCISEILKDYQKRLYALEMDRDRLQAAIRHLRSQQ